VADLPGIGGIIEFGHQDSLSPLEHFGIGYDVGGELKDLPFWLFVLPDLIWYVR
jgi:hypothetical protein